MDCDETSVVNNDEPSAVVDIVNSGDDENEDENDTYEEEDVDLIGGDNADDVTCSDMSVSTASADCDTHVVHGEDDLEAYEPCHDAAWKSRQTALASFCEIEAFASQDRERVLTWAPEPDGTGDPRVADAYEASYAMLMKYLRRDRDGGCAASLQLRSWKEGLRVMCEELSHMSAQGLHGSITISNVRVKKAADIVCTAGLGFHTSASDARMCNGTFATHVIADIMIVHFSDRSECTTQDDKDDTVVTDTTVTRMYLVRDAVLCVLPVMLGSEQDHVDLLNFPPVAHENSPYASIEEDVFVRHNECPHDCGGYFVVGGVEKVFGMQESMKRDEFHAMYRTIHSGKVLVSEFKTAGQQRNNWRAAYPITSSVRIVLPEERVEGSKHGFCLFFGHSLQRKGMPCCVTVWDAMRALGVEDEDEMICLALVTVRGRERIRRGRMLIRAIEGHGCRLSTKTVDEAASEINTLVRSSTNNGLDNILFSHVSISKYYRGQNIKLLRLIKAWHVGMLTSTFINAKLSEPMTSKTATTSAGAGTRKSSAAVHNVIGTMDEIAADGEDDVPQSTDTGVDDDPGQCAATLDEQDEQAVRGASFFTDRDHMQNKRVVGIGDALVELVYASVKRNFMHGAGMIARTATNIDQMITFVRNATTPTMDPNKWSSTTKSVMHAFRSGNWKNETGNISYLVAQTTLKNESNLARITHIRAFAPPRMSIGEAPSGASLERHSLHASQTGTICAANTPEDKGIGIKKVVASLVTLATNRTRVGIICGGRDGDGIGSCEDEHKQRVARILQQMSPLYFVREDTKASGDTSGPSAAVVKRLYCAIRVDDVHCGHICGNYVETVRELCSIFPYDCEVAFPNGWYRSAMNWVNEVTSRRLVEAENGNSDARVSASDPDEWMRHCNDPSIAQFPVRVSLYSTQNVASFISKYPAMHKLKDVAGLALCPLPVATSPSQQPNRPAYRHMLSDASFNAYTCVPVVVNGIIVGVCENEDKVAELVAALRVFKSTDMVTMSIVYVREARTLVISTAGNRFVRPLFVVHGEHMLCTLIGNHHESANNTPHPGPAHFIKCNVTEQDEIATVLKPEILDRNNMRQLVRRGDVEFVDSSEENRLNVSRSVRELIDDGREFGVEFTHCETNPLSLFSVATSTVPWCECVQVPRITFYDHMAQQAMGPLWSNPLQHYARTFNYMPHAQKPLIFTKGSMISGMDDVPAGQNLTVAIMCMGDNMEDNTIFNQYSVDRGLGRAFVCKTVITECEGLSTSMCFEPTQFPSCNTAGAFNRMRAESVSMLGMPVSIGDTIAYVYDINNSAATASSSSEGPSAASRRGRVKYLIQAPCNGYFAHARFVDDVARGTTLLVQRYLVQCIPDCGDKIETRTAQKSTGGLKMCGHMMPWVASNGMTPDIVMNPHAFAARMTWNQIYEIAIAEIATHLGRRFDGSSFEYKVKRGDPQHTAVDSMSVSAEDALAERTEAERIAAEESADAEEFARRMEYVRVAYAKPWDALRDSCAILPADKVARSRVDIIADALQQLGIPKTGRHIMYSANTGRMLEATICIGLSYVQRLKHMAADKVISRSTGPVEAQSNQPMRGGKQGAIRLGEMENDKLVAHGAPRLLAERMSSDVNLYPVCFSCGTFSIVTSGEDASTSSYCKICGRSDTWASVRLPTSTVNQLAHMNCIGIAGKLLFEDVGLENIVIDETSKEMNVDD